MQFISFINEARASKISKSCAKFDYWNKTFVPISNAKLTVTDYALTYYAYRFLPFLLFEFFILHINIIGKIRESEGKAELDQVIRIGGTDDVNIGR